MSGAKALPGLWVPIVTPFAANGDVDTDSLRRLAERLVDGGVAGLVALGTTGEPATLSETEQEAVVAVCADVCRTAGRGLIIGAGSNDTSATTALVARRTSGTDAAAALVVAPYYTRPSPEGLVAHFLTVADASPVPLVIYNVPYRTGVALSAEMLIRLSAHDNIVGLKQAVGALDVDTLSVLAAAAPDFAVLAGDDAFIAPTVLLGGCGAITASAHVATRHFVALVEAALEGRTAPTAALSAALLGIVQAGFAEPNPSVFKAALRAQGEIESAALRLPMTSASDEARRRLIGVLDDLAPVRSFVGR